MNSDDSDCSITPIRYGAVPNSPVHNVSYGRGAEEDTDSDFDIKSPHKKPRTSVARHTSHRRPAQRTTAVNNALAPHVFNDRDDDMVSLGWQGQGEDVLPDGRILPISTDMGSQTDIARSYAMFKESLSWDDSMFTQISEDLFIVHGWNRRRNEATVRFTQFICNMTTNIFRQMYII